MAMPLDEVLDKDILDILGLGNLPEEKKSDLYLKLAEILQNMVIDKIVDCLNREDFETFEKLMEAGDHQKSKEFLAARNIDLQKIFIEQAFLMKAQVASLMDAAKEGQDGGNTTA